MNKIITKTLLMLSLFWLIWVSFLNTSYAALAPSAPATASKGITIMVTEDIPWANCKDISTKKQPNKWKCTVDKWFWSVVKMMWGVIKWFTFIAGLGGVLFLVINGILYSMWGMDQSLKDESKKRISKTLVWLILLFLSWVILNIIAPWIYK